MAIIVQKYGGSSVADVDKLRAVARKIVETKERGHEVVVVVSAMGNATNELLERAHLMSDRPNRRELDMLLSVGERTSMALLSMGIHALGHEAISFTGSQSGIITNDSHANARIIEVRPYRIQDELERGRIVIVAGFQGTSYKREITTLGRGGSDMTAVALAAALSAKRCEIYSDVDGVFSADPRVVLDAQRLSSVSADEMLEMATHGAQVLFDQAVAYAKRSGIALYAKATHQSSSKGTVVRPDGWPDEALARGEISPKGVASFARLIVVRGALGGVGALTVLRDVLPRAKVLHAHLTGHGEDLLVLDPTHIGDLEGAEAKLEAALGEGAELLLNSTNISVVGQEIGCSPAWAITFSEALKGAGVPLRALVIRAHALMALVPVSSRDEAMRAAHSLVC